MVFYYPYEILLCIFENDTRFYEWDFEFRAFFRPNFEGYKISSMKSFDK